VRERVASADGGADFGHKHSALASELEDFAERDFQIFLNVVAKRLERRNVKNLGTVRQFPTKSFAHQAVDTNEKCGERFSGTCRSRDERGFAGENVWPALLLRLRRRSEAADKPIADKRVRPFQARESRSGNLGHRELDYNVDDSAPADDGKRGSQLFRRTPVEAETHEDSFNKSRLSCPGVSGVTFRRD